MKENEKKKKHAETKFMQCCAAASFGGNHIDHEIGCSQLNPNWYQYTHTRVSWHVYHSSPGPF